MHDLGLAISAFGLGAALGLAPGPVQFVLLSEASRGGRRRGFQAMAGANGTFGALLVGVAVGVSVLAPSALTLRVLEVVGGGFLLWMAWDAFSSSRRQASEGESSPSGVPPLARGSLAVIVNPGAWVFLATSASAILADATRRGGRGLAIVIAVALLAGLAVIDGTMVALGGSRALRGRVGRIVAPILAGVLAAFGLALLIQGLRP